MSKSIERRLLLSVTIKDCDVQTFSVGGHGGTGKDTSNSGVRVVHRASGATGEGRESRSQFENKKAAFKRMAETPIFQTWIKLKAAELHTGKTVEQRVEETMQAKNLKIEVKTEKGWELVRCERCGSLICRCEG